MINPGAYTSSYTVNDLASGDSIQVTFPDQFMFESGPYTATVYTQLEDDGNPDNDTLEKIIETYDPGIAEENSNVPELFAFYTPTITKKKSEVKLALPQATKVNLIIYDVLGRLTETVISERFSAGNHRIGINLNLPAGIYFYYLNTTSGEEKIEKFVLLE
jgi:hypothetical protein